MGKGSHPDMVKVFGPGVERSGLKANEPTHFTVDCSGAGDGKTNSITVCPHSNCRTSPLVVTSTLLAARVSSND